MDLDTRAQMSAQDINNLPDSAFAFIQSGGSKDASGRTVPRSLRHFPIHDAEHVRAALARIAQGAAYGSEAKPKVLAAAKKFGIDVAGMNSASQSGYAERQVPFEVAQTRGGDGLTLEGYAAVFNSPTRIDSWEGTFDEVILPGAFRNVLARQTPVLMFEHGRHPLIGTMPLGVITRAAEDSKGLHIEARLSDNWLIQPVRDAVRDGGVTGMSFRFDADGGDKWQKRAGNVDLRSIHDFAAVPELGPVVFPAYEPTTAAIRSLVGLLPHRPTRALPAPAAVGAEYDDNPVTLALAADAALDAAIAAMTPDMVAMCGQACALMTAADLALDALLEALGVPDPDDPADGGDSTGMAGMADGADMTGMGRSKDLAGRPDARSAGGSDATTAQPAERGRITIRQSLDDGALRARGLIK